MTSRSQSLDSLQRRHAKSLLLTAGRAFLRRSLSHRRKVAMDTWWADFTCCRVAKESRVIAQNTSILMPAARPVVPLNIPSQTRYATVKMPLPHVHATQRHGLMWGRCASLPWITNTGITHPGEVLHRWARKARQRVPSRTALPWPLPRQTWPGASQRNTRQPPTTRWCEGGFELRGASGGRIRIGWATVLETASDGAGTGQHGRACATSVPSSFASALSLHLCLALTLPLCGTAVAGV